MKQRLARLLLVLPLLGSMGILSAASTPPADDRPTCKNWPCLSQFDYVVLASFADSSNLSAMSTYRSLHTSPGDPLTADSTDQPHIRMRP